jgi:hypothetical protein
MIIVIIIIIIIMRESNIELDLEHFLADFP